MERKTVDGHARIAQGDPRRGQGFAPLTGRGDLRILPGDQLTTTCEFDSSSRTVGSEASPWRGACGSSFSGALRTIRAVADVAAGLPVPANCRVPA